MISSAPPPSSTRDRDFLLPFPQLHPRPRLPALVPVHPFENLPSSTRDRDFLLWFRSEVQSRLTKLEKQPKKTQTDYQARLERLYKGTVSELTKGFVTNVGWTVNVLSESATTNWAEIVGIYDRILGTNGAAQREGGKESCGGAEREDEPSSPSDREDTTSPGQELFERVKTVIAKKPPNPEKNATSTIVADLRYYLMVKVLSVSDFLVQAWQLCKALALRVETVEARMDIAAPRGTEEVGSRGTEVGRLYQHCPEDGTQSHRG